MRKSDFVLVSSCRLYKPGTLHIRKWSRKKNLKAFVRHIKYWFLCVLNPSSLWKDRRQFVPKPKAWSLRSQSCCEPHFFGDNLIIGKSELRRSGPSESTTEQKATGTRCTKKVVSDNSLRLKAHYINIRMKSLTISDESIYMSESTCSEDILITQIRIFSHEVKSNWGNTDRLKGKFVPWNAEF